METTWEKVAEAISTILKVPVHILDLISNMEILELCARGKSLSSISAITGIPAIEISEILSQYNLFFFVSGLDFDALVIYKESHGNKREYIDYLCYKYPDIDELLLTLSFDNVETFLNYRKEIDAYYANSNS